jgi:hypothetical protein
MAYFPVKYHIHGLGINSETQTETVSTRNLPPQDGTTTPMQERVQNQNRNKTRPKGNHCHAAKT